MYLFKFAFDFSGYIYYVIKFATFEKSYAI